MFKLIFLTLLAFVTVLIVFGEGEGRKVTEAAVEVTEAQADSPADAAEEEEEDQSAAAESAAEVEQTPERVAEFAGPELRPSPEYAGQEPEEDLSEALTDTLFVTGSAVNFRAGPSTSDEIVGRLTRGQMVTAIGDKTGDWIELRDGQGRTGFMSAQFLSADRP